MASATAGHTQQKRFSLSVLCGSAVKQQCMQLHPRTRVLGNDLIRLELLYILPCIPEIEQDLLCVLTEFRSRSP